MIASQLENGSPGPEILSKLLSENDLLAVRYIIGNHYHTVAQGKFEWLLDLREAGYNDDVILDSLLESTESGPWTISNFHESWKFEENNSDSEEHVLPNFHEPSCVQTGPDCGDSLSVTNGTRRSSECQPALSFDKIENIPAEVAELCGVAGVYPPFYNAGDHRATFEDTCVRIEYVPLPTSPPPYNNLSKTILPWQLTTFLSRTTRRLCRALRLLQESRLCCDRLTVLVDRIVLDQAVVSMVPIALEDVAAFHITALELCRQHGYMSKSGMGQPSVDIALLVDSKLHRKLSRCWIKARALLSGLFSSEPPQFQVDLSWNIPLQLHECVLTCQLLAVAPPPSPPQPGIPNLLPLLC